MNILVLDDEPIELEQLELLVKAHYPSWQVEKALYASEALKLAEEKIKNDDIFHLALVDIKLPGTTGLEVSIQLKELMPAIEIIIVSAYQDFEYAKQSIHLKVMDYLLKPVIEKELVVALKLFNDKMPEANHYKEIVQKIIDIVKDKYKESLKFSDISNELHMNVSYLSRLFKEEVGVTFSEYVLNYRIKHAKYLLTQNKDYSMLEIAESCGFNSQQYFSNVFKRIVGCSPNVYKNKRNF